MVKHALCRRAGRLLMALGCACALLGADPAAAQGTLETRLQQLQAELKSERKRAESLRAEVKRQQRAIGEARQRIETLEAAGKERDRQIVRLKESDRALWLGVFGVGLLALLVGAAAAARRATGARESTELRAARERTRRLKDEMSALDARIRAAEQRRP